MPAKKKSPDDIAVEVVPIDTFIDDDQNANAGTEDGEVMLGASLSLYGPGRSALTDAKGKLIAGNKTRNKAKLAGITEAIIAHTKGDRLVVVQRDDMDLDTDPRARELAIADNRVGEKSLEWNTERLAQALADENIDLNNFFDPSEIKELTAEVGDNGDFEEWIDQSPDEKPEIEFTAELLERHNYLVFTFRDDFSWNVIRDALEVEKVKALDSAGESWQRAGVGRVKPGSVLIDLLTRVQSLQSRVEQLEAENQQLRGD